MAKKYESQPEPDTALADSVLAYLNLLDGPTGGNQEYQEALDAIVAALPESHVPDSLTGLKQEDLV